MLSGGCDAAVCVWEWVRRLRDVRIHAEAVWSVAALDDLATAVSAAADGAVKAWTIDSGEAQTVAVGDFPVCVRALTGRQFAVGCRSGSIRIFARILERRRLSGQGQRQC
jgi:WD40 repeat protein